MEQTPPAGQAPDVQPQLQQNIEGESHKVMGGNIFNGPAVLQQSEARMFRVENTVRRNREVLERDLTATRRWMMALFACIVFLLSTLSEMNNKIETMEEKQKLHDQIMEYHDRNMSALENHPLLQGEDGEMLLISTTGSAAEWKVHCVECGGGWGSTTAAPTTSCTTPWRPSVTGSSTVMEVMGSCFLAGGG